LKVIVAAKRGIPTALGIFQTTNPPIGHSPVHA